MTTITPELARATLELPYLTDAETVYLTAVATGNLNALHYKWDAGLIKQREYLLTLNMTGVECPACHTPITEIGSRTKDDARADDHHCPICRVRLSHHIGLLDGEQFWVLQHGQTVEIR